MPYNSNLKNYLNLLPNTNEAGMSFHERAKVIEWKGFKEINFDANNLHAFFMLDYIERKYVYVHESTTNMFGYRPEYFLDNGVESFADKLDPDSLDVFQKKIFRKNMDFVKQLAPEKVSDFIFTHSFKIRASDGSLLKLAQQSCFIVSEKGTPQGAIGYLTNISAFKTDDCIDHMIEDRTAPFNKRVVFENHYYLNHDKTLISKRELEVLKWIGEGFSTKQIADKLGISINTVSNHRKSMLKKTNCKNSFELVNNAIRNGDL